MSNLIKSGKVVEVGTPVNVGVSYSYDEANRIILEQTKRISELNQGVSEINGTPPKDMKILAHMTKAEIISQYIEEAQKEASNVYNQEREKAYNEGIEKSKEEAEKIIEGAKAKYEEILEEIVKLKDEALKEYKEEMKNNEKEIVDLAFQMAEKIINYEINKSDDYVLGIIEDALTSIVNKKDVVLKLSTQDYYLVQANKKLLVTKIKGFGEIELVQDESMDPGSCIVDTPLGVIDGSLQVRMDNLQNEVKEIIATQGN